MNTNLLLLSTLSVTLGAFAAETSGATNLAISGLGSVGPRIVFPEPAFEFGKVESGELIKHSFVFTNLGDQMLEISEVKPSCGCTTAGTWDKAVGPGQSGTIPVQFNSTGYGGAVHKTVTVVCNDRQSSNVVLHVSGTIWKPIDVTPSLATFNFNPDVQTTETRVLRIVNNLDEPLTLSEPNCTNPLFQPKLKTVKEGKEFELSVTVVPPLGSPSVSAPISLKTSNPKIPVLSISAFAMIQPMVTVAPSQLMLPTGPLTNSQFTVIVQNNSTNPLALSEPTINAKGVEARLTEVQGGKRFELLLAFSSEFHGEPGQPVEASVKSNFPQLPLIKVPVLQVLPPASPPAAVALSTSTNAALAPSNSTRSNSAPSVAVPPSNASVSAAHHGPSIEFAATAFDFGRVESGKVVSHNFPFTNKGDEPLEIHDVLSSCGCTTTGNYSRRLEPGQSGSIPVLFNVSGMGGPVAKTLWVQSNDLERSNVLLQISATVWKSIDAIPGIATFTFGPDFQTNESRVIRLVSNLDEPVTLSEPVCTNSTFRAQLKTVREGKEFELVVSVTPPVAPGSTVAPITLQTSSAKMPVLTVTAYAVAQPALTVMPPRIILPQEPLAEPAQFTVTIQNQSANLLALSDPTINAKGASVELHEIQPGRLFHMTVNFPAGFRTQPNLEIEARVRSTHSQFPHIRVPILRTAFSDGNDTANSGRLTLSAQQALPDKASPIALKP